MWTREWDTALPLPRGRSPIICVDLKPTSGRGKWSRLTKVRFPVFPILLNAFICGYSNSKVEIILKRLNSRSWDATLRAEKLCRFIVVRRVSILNQFFFVKKNIASALFCSCHATNNHSVVAYFQRHYWGKESVQNVDDKIEVAKDVYFQICLNRTRLRQFRAALVALRRQLPSRIFTSYAT